MIAWIRRLLWVEPQRPPVYRGVTAPPLPVRGDVWDAPNGRLYCYSGTEWRRV